MTEAVHNFFNVVSDQNQCRPVARTRPLGKPLCEPEKMLPSPPGSLGLTAGSFPALLGDLILRPRLTLLFGTLLLLPFAAGASTSKDVFDGPTHKRESAYSPGYASKLKTSAVSAIPAAPAKASSSSSSEASSMYDPSTARKITPELMHIFGPRSGGVRYDSRMIHAAQIAENRARQHSIRSCWRYVKTALLEANVVKSYPKTAYAKQAGDELLRDHGFRKLSIKDPFKAPVGSVLVYGGRGAGHVEIRTVAGFVSDFESPTPSKRPLLGVFVKPG